MRKLTLKRDCTEIEELTDRFLCNKAFKLEDPKDTSNAIAKVKLKLRNSSLKADIEEIYLRLLDYIGVTHLYEDVYFNVSSFVPRAGLLELFVFERSILRKICLAFVLNGNFIETAVQIDLFKVEVYFKEEPLSPAFPYPRNSVSIIISKSQENVSWIPPEWYQFVYLYDENGSLQHSLSQTLPISSYKHYECLSSGEKESHSYLSHIIQNYDQLTDILYFTPANPFVYSPNFIQWVNAGIGEIGGFVPLGNRQITIRGGNVTEGEREFPGIQREFESIIQHLFYDISFSEEGIPVQFPEEFTFSPGAVFAVSKECISRRPKEFYEKILQIVSYYSNIFTVNHCLEMLWSLIFSNFPN
jgi:hypothetical protein